MAHFRKKQPVPVAIELNHKTAEELMKYLQERLDEDGSGAIRVHLLCDLSHV